jgi:large subunit ribosomal protein L17
MEGYERKLRLVGNRLGDNASRVIFELIGDVEEEQEIAPKVSVAEEKG